ncbi:DUF485 domain-containing protein [Acinetobacter stercoris]|uniref:Inner membrane protein YjcH n=1 Tax=Acinetobacter stercoris TaxID=2126983 RepID=A0A2U3MXQ9_9GAMM|nr:MULTISPECIES: DUF485 domain-containing protein [Acinetobacter]SPL70222.1 Inner membrane protein YjcH [Acinetobacter stercoris]
MDDVQVQRILQNPKFKQMVSKKSTLSWTLTIFMLVVYVGFMLLVGYNKEFLMSSFSGGVTTWGIPLGLGIIVLSFLLCGVYSYIANNSFDQLTNEAMKEVEAITHEKTQTHNADASGGNVV